MACFFDEAYRKHVSLVFQFIGQFDDSFACLLMDTWMSGKRPGYGRFRDSKLFGQVNYGGLVLFHTCLNLVIDGFGKVI